MQVLKQVFTLQNAGIYHGMSSFLSFTGSILFDICYDATSSIYYEETQVTDKSYLQYVSNIINKTISSSILYIQMV